ncbi:MAG: ABC transporter ATP-binding protein [Clostridium butyricum]|nr:ABC transporter ATP-binding protein [Clostridium butyricum]
MKKKKENNNFIKQKLYEIKKRILGKQRDQADGATFKDLVSSLKYHYRNLYNWTPKLFFIGIFRIIPDTLIPVFGIILPTMVVKGLEQRWDVNKFILYVGGLMTIMLIFNLINAKMQAILQSEKDNYRFRYLQLLCDKKMDVDYDILESQDFQNKQKYAFHWIAEWSEPIERCISSIGVLTACILGSLAYGIALAKQSTILMIFIVVSVFIWVKLHEDAIAFENTMWSKNVKERRKMGYINNQAMDFAVGKDIRLYNMQSWFRKMYRTFLKISEAYINKIQARYGIACGINAVMVFIRDSAAYIYLIYEIANKRLTVSDFILYTSLVAGFNVWISRGIDEIQYLVRGSYAFFAIRKCFDVENKWNASDKKDHAISKNNEIVKSIEFKDVSFYYNEKEKPTISHLNLNINSGEKIALVGLNGAGKTTLVKLLCGFYEPTEGEILVNGKSIREYEREEYYSMISAVFQDAQILPVSIAENISSQPKENTDMQRVNLCLKLSGLNEKIEKLKDGKDTFLVRELSSKAIDLSGGEKQKLLLARALYKQSQIIVLDEPTAALDPIAENEIYLKYNSLTKGMMSLFISHRLSSTRFCDRIILLENGNIAEEGTHDSLMDLKGRYAHMYDIQSRYYKKKIDMREGGEAYV